jgi:hypothetical protein
LEKRQKYCNIRKEEREEGRETKSIEGGREASGFVLSLEGARKSEREQGGRG